MSFPMTDWKFPLRQFTGKTYKAITHMLTIGLSLSDLLSPYYGHFIGKLSNKEKQISCNLFAVDKSTIAVQNFTYEGEARKF